MYFLHLHKHKQQLFFFLPLNLEENLDQEISTIIMIWFDFIGNAVWRVSNTEDEDTL